MPARSHKILSIWIACIKDRNIENIVDLYNNDAILIPTFSNKMFFGSQKIKHYFEQVFKRDHLDIDLHNNTIKIQRLSENLSAISGIYCWRMGIDDDLFSFEARFTFIVDDLHAQPILHHHSSQIPRAL